MTSNELSTSKKTSLSTELSTSKELSTLDEVPRRVWQKVGMAVAFGIGLDSAGVWFLRRFYTGYCDPQHLVGACKG